MANDRKNNETEQKPLRVGQAEHSHWRIYKMGQGYYVRMGSAIGAGVLLLLGCNYIYSILVAGHFLPERLRDYDILIQIGVPVLVLLVVGFILFRVLNTPRIVDFFIAVESEMRKVNWTSRREVIGSTKVVILTVLVLGFFLAAIDILFMFFFKTIGVLQF